MGYRAELTLSPGVYNFRSLIVAGRAKIILTGTTTDEIKVRIAEDMLAGGYRAIIPADGIINDISASEVVFFVVGEAVTPGGTGADDTIEGGGIDATVYAKGDLSILGSSVARGAFFGESVSVGYNALVIYDSFFRVP